LTPLRVLMPVTLGNDGCQLCSNCLYIVPYNFLVMVLICETSLICARPLYSYRYAATLTFRMQSALISGKNTNQKEKSNLLILV